MKFFLSFLALLTFSFTSPMLAKANNGLENLSNGLSQVQGVANQVGGIVNDVRSITSGGSGGASSTTSGSQAAGMFNPDTLFPAWGDGGQVKGVIGSNGGALNQGQGRLLWYFIPKIIEILIWLVAPMVTVMFIYAGMQYIWSGGNEEQTNKARDTFKFAAIGLVFVVLSYSLSKAIFFLLA